MKYTIIGICLIFAAVILIAAAVVIMITGNKAEKKSGYRKITQDEAKEMMKRADGHIIVDVRRIDEYDGGHIPGAVCIPNESIGSEMPAELPDKQQIILVYCRSGRRSKEAAQKLSDMGYVNVYEFGGILDWTGETITKEDEEMQNAITPTAVLVVQTQGKTFYASLCGNSSAKAFAEKLSPAPLTLQMSDYGGFEKVAELPFSLPQNDEQITTKPGDIILYQGNKITVYYGENTYTLTRLASIGNTTRDELLAALGEGDATVRFYLEWSE